MCNRAAVPFFRGEELEGIRAACRVGRDVLDAGHAAIAPGVTTDEIDRVVRPLSWDSVAMMHTRNVCKRPEYLGPL